MTAPIWPTIVAWSKGNEPTAAEREQVSGWMLDPARAAVWQLEAASVTAALADRIQLLQSIGQKLWREQVELPLPGTWTDWIEPMWTLWLPLALRIDQAQRSQALGSSPYSKPDSRGLSFRGLTCSFKGFWVDREPVKRRFVKLCSCC